MEVISSEVSVFNSAVSLIVDLRDNALNLSLLLRLCA
jgi:hypothetical protein